MEDILLGIINFFGGIIDSFISYFNTKKSLVIIYFILIICLFIVYILLKDF